MQKNLSFLIFLTLLLGSSCVSYRESGKDKNVTSQSIKVQKEGIALDAHYDPRLDNLVPGYKIITVAVTNDGIDVLKFDTLRDRWEIVDAYGRNQKAIASLRIRDPKAFGRLPARMQEMLDYPIGVAVGYSETVDLLFPAETELKAFRSVRFYSAERKFTYDVLASLDSAGQIPMAAPENVIDLNKVQKKKKP